MSRQREGLRVALVAPPCLPEPAAGYQGVDRIVADLAGGLVRQGHDVALLLPPRGRPTTRGTLAAALDLRERRASPRLAADHVERALTRIDVAHRRGRPFDVIHDHSGSGLIARAGSIDAPVLHTIHGPLTLQARDVYRMCPDNVWVSALSQWQLREAPAHLRNVGVIPNPVDLRAWPLQPRKDRYLLWAGRLTPEAGPHRAIAVASAAGWPLVLAGPVPRAQEGFFASAIGPHLGDLNVHYVETVEGRRRRTLFAHAAALLVPTHGPEPFAMGVIEAMACGTPVITFRRGPAAELVLDGVSGFLAEDEIEMAASLKRLGELEPHRCRAVVAERYDVAVVARAYAASYRKLGPDATAGDPLPRGAS